MEPDKPWLQLWQGAMKIYDFFFRLHVFFVYHCMCTEMSFRECCNMKDMSSNQPLSHCGHVCQVPCIRKWDYSANSHCMNRDQTIFTSILSLVTRWLLRDIGLVPWLAHLNCTDTIWAFHHLSVQPECYETMKWLRAISVRIILYSVYCALNRPCMG